MKMIFSSHFSPLSEVPAPLLEYFLVPAPLLSSRLFENNIGFRWIRLRFGYRQSVSYCFDLSNGSFYPIYAG